MLQRLKVEAGETIDFVIDIGEILNNDQYLWEATVAESATDTTRLTWNSKADFPQDTVNQLTPWEQLAQVLLCSNEFLFVD